MLHSFTLDSWLLEKKSNSLSVSVSRVSYTVASLIGPLLISSGYDPNDLDLDMFCQEIIRPDIDSLKVSPCLNAYLGPRPREPVRSRSMTLIEATEQDQHSDSESDDDVFRVT